MPKTGRPRKEIDWLQLESIVSRNGQLNYCAERQLLRWGDEVNFKTIKSCRELIERRIYERFRLTFTEYKQEKLEPLRISIFDKQYDMAMKGSVPLLIWLGKQMLNQSDRQDTRITMPQVNYSDSELDARINELSSKNKLKIV